MRHGIPKKRTNLEGAFPITSLSALKDYLLYAPHLVQEIRHKPSHAGKIRELLGECRAQISLREDSSLEHFFVADVAVTLAPDVELFEALAAEATGAILILDHIQDARNFGAIVRTAAFYGVKWLVVAKDRQVLLSAASVNTAQAGFARTKVVHTVNIARFLRELKDYGYWVYGLDLAGKPVEAKSLSGQKLALVLGSEDKGLSANVRNTCDGLWKLGPSLPGLDSLNVSVAAGIVLDRISELSGGF